MPIKDDEEDDESESESEAEDAATGDVSAPAAATAAAADDSASSPAASTAAAAAVPLDRKVSVVIDLEEKDIPVTLQVGSGAVMTWVRVPRSSSLESSKNQFRRTNFIPHLLHAVADKDNEEDAAFWLFMSVGRKFPKGFEMAAKCLGYIPWRSHAR
jgi:hypothetical protein